MQFARHLISWKKEFRKLNNPNGNMTINHLDVAVVQQYGAIKDSPVRGAMIGNSNIFHKLKSKPLTSEFWCAIRILVFGKLDRLRWSFSSSGFRVGSQRNDSNRFPHSLTVPILS
jgi:hypothetical protein